MISVNLVFPLYDSNICVPKCIILHSLRLILNDLREADGSRWKIRTECCECCWGKRLKYKYVYTCICINICI